MILIVYICVARTICVRRVGSVASDVHSFTHIIVTQCLHIAIILHTWHISPLYFTTGLLCISCSNTRRRRYKQDPYYSLPKQWTNTRARRRYTLSHPFSRLAPPWWWLASPIPISRLLSCDTWKESESATLRLIRAAGVSTLDTCSPSARCNCVCFIPPHF